MADKKWYRVEANSSQTLHAYIEVGHHENPALVADDFEAGYFKANDEDMWSSSLWEVCNWSQVEESEIKDIEDWKEKNKTFRDEVKQQGLDFKDRE